MNFQQDRNELVHATGKGKIETAGKIADSKRRFMIECDRDFTNQETSDIREKQPMLMECVSKDADALKLNSAQKGSTIEVSGMLSPLYYIWKPSAKSIEGTRLIVPDATQVGGMARPYEITQKPNWQKNRRSCLINSFTINVDETNMADESQINQFLDDEELPQVSAYTVDKIAEQSAKLLNIERDDDEMKLSVSGDNLQTRESIGIYGIGRVWNVREPYKSFNARGDEQHSSEFQFTANPNPFGVKREVQKLQTVQLRCTAWNELAHLLQDVQNNTPIEISGYLEPRYMIWYPSDDPFGFRITLGDPSPTRQNPCARPMELLQEEWDRNCHLFWTFQPTIQTITIDGKEYTSTQQGAKPLSARGTSTMDDNTAITADTYTDTDVEEEADIDDVEPTTYDKKTMTEKSKAAAESANPETVDETEPNSTDTNADTETDNLQEEIDNEMPTEEDVVPEKDENGQDIPF